jgi:hypothetical protein
LEGVIQKDFLNGLPSTSGLTMVGPGAGLHFEPGPGSPTYCGVDPGIDPGETIPNNPTCTVNPNVPTGPAIGVSDPTGLAAVLLAAGNTQIQPPPAVITDSPDWQQSPAALDGFLALLRSTAITSHRYLPASAGGNSLQNSQSATPYINANEYLTGDGVTFCEGNCSVGPLSGGGILVVTGNFEYNGNFNFRGTIFVIGDMHRDGGGTGVILGSVIVAKYDLSNPSAGFQSPRFTTTGGGTSDIIYNGAVSAFDGTAAVTDLMIGIAEK